MDKKLYVRQIGNKLKKDYERLWDTNLDETNNYSRILAYWSVYQELISHGATANINSIRITDGSKDYGIDAVGIDRENNTIVLCQSKWATTGSGSGIDLGGMLKFIQGCKYILDMESISNEDKQDSSLFQCDLMVDLEDMILDILPGLKIVFLSTTTGNSDLADEIRMPMDRFLSELNLDGSDEMFSFEHRGLSYNYNLISTAKKTVDFKMQLLNFGRLSGSGDQVVYYGRVNASEIASIYNEHGNNLFSENIRLGKKSDVNDGIKQTIRQSPENFFLYNNGITVIAEEINRPAGGSNHTESVQLSLKNASVVNGAQTVSSLGQMIAEDDGGRLSEGSVFVKCIAVPVGNDELARTITRFANTQNDVSNQDFAYLDENQHRLQRELKLEGFTYNIRSSEIPSDESVKNISLREAIIALACADPDIKYSTIAKGSVGKLFDYDERQSNYRHIFNERTQAFRLVNSVMAMRRVSRVLDDYRKENRNGGVRNGVPVHGKLFITYLVLNDIPASVLSNHDLSFNFIDENFEERVKSYLSKIIAVFEESPNESGEYSTSIPNAYPGNVFKNQSKVKLLSEAISN